MAVSTNIGFWRGISVQIRTWNILSVFARKSVNGSRNGLQNLPHLSDHLARDIGLTAAELELSRHKLPSQHTHHPRG